MFENLKILIVDDMFINIEIILSLIKKYKTENTYFTNSNEAYEYIITNEPDVVFIDYLMPGLNGIDLSKRIKCFYPETLIVMITSCDDPDLKLTALQIGINDFLNIPIDKFEFDARIRNLLTIRNTQKILKMHNEQLEAAVLQATGELVQDIEDRKEIEFELQKALEKSETASMAKSLFLANMSHELRSPVNEIFEMTEILSYSNISERDKDYIESIKKSAKNLLSMINNIIYLSSLEAGDPEVKNEKFEINELIKKIMKANERNAQNKNLDLTYSIDSKIPGILIGDYEKIESIITLLLNNAIKFTQQGSVNIELKFIKSLNNSNEIEFIISDTGSGILPEQKNIIFQPFVQGDLSYTKKFPGLGIGLIIVKKLVTLLGGNIDYESSVGIGTKFFFNLQLLSI